jgi:formylmethanofuran dehydrogenase subunit C
MSALVLRLKAPGRLPIDASALSPDGLAGLGAEEIRRLPLQIGNQKLPLAELFELEPGDAEDVVIEGAVAALDRLGQGMSRGRLAIQGDAGAYLGLGQSGGRIEVEGDVGIYAGAMMRGGEIRIAGDAGDFLAGALPGEMRGMRGGLVLVGGNAGDRAGDRMRRGTVIVAGDAGDFPACRIIGGTLAILGRSGVDPGLQMRRGTLILGTAPANLLLTFQENVPHALPWLGLLGRELAAAGWKGLLPGADGRPLDRLTGDTSVGGRGEILAAAA